MNNILLIISTYDDIIEDKQILTQRQDNRIMEFRIRLNFVDKSILEITEIFVFDLNKRKYSFQWMNENYDLKIRWDNAPHHRQFSTFPHHKHIEKEENIESSEEATVAEVLDLIRKSIAK
jgi:Family of unknown function (DUF6516)